MSVQGNKGVNKPKKAKKPRRKNIFDSLGGKNMTVPLSLREEDPIKYVPRFMYATFLGLLYIANSHYSEKTLIEVAELEKEVNKLSFDYKNFRWEKDKLLEYNVIVPKARRLGLIENDKPLIRVRLIKDKP